MFLSFSRGLTLRLRGLEEAKKTPRESALLPYPGFRSFGTVASLEKCLQLSNQFATNANH